LIASIFNIYNEVVNPKGVRDNTENNIPNTLILKIGDWVELKSDNYHGIITKVFSDNTFTIIGRSEHFISTDISRKLRPSEVVVNIGNLSGTISKIHDRELSKTHFCFHKIGTRNNKNSSAWCLISLNMLDNDTYNIVKLLLDIIKLKSFNKIKYKLI